MLRLTARLVLDTHALLGEGLQLFPNGNLAWVDIEQGEVNVIEAGRTRLLRKFPHRVSKVLPWSEGYLVFGETEIYGFSDIHEELVRLEINKPGSNLRFSDGCVLPDGSVLIGIVDIDLAPGRGSLVRIAKDWSLTTLVSKATIPNGTAVLASSDAFFWVDSPTGQISKFKFDKRTGTIGAQEVFANIDPALGVPDGICTDQDGGVWVALWGGGKVLRLNSRGKIDCEISVDCKNVTSCAFSKDDNLVITTAAATLSGPEALQTGAGGIWMVPADAHGRRGLRPLRAQLDAPKSNAKHLSKTPVKSSNYQMEVQG